jgi:hypothetical protein
MRVETLKDYLDLLDIELAEILESIETGQLEPAHTRLLGCQQLVTEMQAKFKEGK